MADNPTPREGQIIFYTTPEGVTKVEVVFQDETFWLTINRMADLFSTSKQDVSYHLQQIYETKKLKRGATVKEILTNLWKPHVYSFLFMISLDRLGIFIAIVDAGSLTAAAAVINPRIR